MLLPNRNILILKIIKNIRNKTLTIANEENILMKLFNCKKYEGRMFIFKVNSESLEHSQRENATLKSKIQN